MASKLRSGIIHPVSFLGFRGVGKDTFFEFLQTKIPSYDYYILTKNNNNFRCFTLLLHGEQKKNRIAWATQLKVDTCKDLGIPLISLSDGNFEKHKNLPLKQLLEVYDKVSTEERTVRACLIEVALVKQKVDPDRYVTAPLQEIQQLLTQGTIPVITDTRKEKEYELMKKLGAMDIKLYRDIPIPPEEIEHHLDHIEPDVYITDKVKAEELQTLGWRLNLTFHGYKE